MRSVSVLLAGLIAVLLAGCSSTPSNMSFSPTAPPGRTPYPGPLTASSAPATPSRTTSRPGAAADVVQCSVRPTGATLHPGSEQAPDASVEAAVDESVSTELPVRELARERDDGDRVLFTTSYGGIARQAVIVRRADPVSDRAAHDTNGWYVESYAYCDLADYPDRVAAAAGVEIWTDARGVRQPTTAIRSGPGPEHCDEQRIRFLTLGSRTNPYVDTIPPDLRDDFAEQPRRHVTVPADAVDTGFRRRGRHLWVSPDRRRAYVGSITDAALWPREVRAFGCA
jgi:hypothetical protein